MMFLVWLPFCTYTSSVRPHLEYASMVWNPYTSSDINLLEAVQNQAALDSCHLGSCLGSKSSHTCLSELKWPSLEPISLLIISIACYVIWIHFYLLTVSNQLKFCNQVPWSKIWDRSELKFSPQSFIIDQNSLWNWYLKPDHIH